jgi:hypothetical protein
MASFPPESLDGSGRGSRQGSVQRRNHLGVIGRASSTLEALIAIG